MRALRSFASVFNVSVGDVSISVDPEVGVADSGDLELDLADLFLRIAEAAKAGGRAWTLLVDEVQYSSVEELSAINVAIHRVNQKSLPVMFFGAGLPQVAALSGAAKSFSERIFNYPAVGALGPNAAKEAIQQPVENEGETIADEALDEIVSKTHGYPYFCKNGGYQTWNAADASPISAADVLDASAATLRRLDEGFFKVRFERLTPKERDYDVQWQGWAKGRIDLQTLQINLARMSRVWGRAGRR